MRLWLLAWLLPLTTHAAAPSAALDQRAVALGEPVLLIVQAKDADLSQVDLTPLQTDFEVFGSAASRSETRGRVQSRLEVTLYPLRTGPLQVPPLRVLHQTTPALKLEVTAGRGNIPAVSLRAWIAPEYPMEREAAMLHLLISDDGSLAWDVPAPPSAANAYLSPAGNERVHERIEADGSRRVTHEFRWRVLPLKAANMTLALPTLDAHLFGKRLRFPAPAVSLHPRPAPASLPLQLPIGRPVVRTMPPTDLRVGRPANWIVDVDAPGLSADGLRQLLGTPQHPALKFYAPVIAGLRENGQDGLRVTLSLVPLVADEIALPPLSLPYFDAASGQLRELRVDTPQLIARDPRRVLALQIALGLLGTLALAWGGVRGVRWGKRRQRKQAWLHRLDTAADAAALHRALTTHAPIPSQTLQAWRGRQWITPTMIDELERLRFGPASANSDWHALKTAWRLQVAQLPLRCFT